MSHPVGPSGSTQQGFHYPTTLSLKYFLHRTASSGPPNKGYLGEKCHEKPVFAGVVLSKHIVCMQMLVIITLCMDPRTKGAAFYVSLSHC